MANKYLVQDSWLTELPTMEKPVGHGFPTNESYRKFKENKYEYDQHLATLPKICCCEGLKDGAIVEENVDFVFEDKYIIGITEDGSAETTSGWRKVAIPLHREQGEAYPTQGGDLPSIAEIYSTPLEDELTASTPAGKEVAQPWQQVISDRINYFATHHHKFESKELHDALNVILRLVHPALWQAASQEKGVEVRDILIGTQKEYISFLGNECARLQQFAGTHGMEMDKSIFRRGEMFRNDISDLTLKVALSESHAPPLAGSGGVGKGGG